MQCIRTTLNTVYKIPLPVDSTSLLPVILLVLFLLESPKHLALESFQSHPKNLVISQSESKISGINKAGRVAMSNSLPF
jgi:hypothetical protein